MDLNAPLGFEPPPPRRRLLPAVALGLVLALVGVLGVAVYEADPHGGEPYAVAVIPPAPTTRPALPAPREAVDPAPTGSIGGGAPAASAANSTRIENGVRIVSPLVAERQLGRDAGPQIIDVSKALDESARKAALPPSRTGADALAPVGAGAGPRPRVAILVGGLGLNAIATRTAVELMPAPVSLAFVPTGADVASAVGTAREKGHEILLQIPMQGANGAAPGPHALTTAESPDDRAADLDWLMHRFDGYSGTTNLLGAAVSADASAMQQVLRTVGKRGLYYIDDGTSRASTALAVAARVGVPAVKADVVLDATNDPAAVQANLDRLVAIARTQGSAIGAANDLSDHLHAIARFAQEAPQRGFDLVPVGAIARGPARVSTSR